MAKIKHNDNNKCHRGSGITHPHTLPAVLSHFVLCLTVCDPMDCSPPGSSVLGILEARILEWIDMPSSRGIFPSQGLNPRLLHLLHCRQILYPLSHLGNPILIIKLIIFMKKKLRLREIDSMMRWQSKIQSCVGPENPSLIHFISPLFTPLAVGVYL